MTWTAPRLIVEATTSDDYTVDPDACTWLDLSDRMLGFAMTRGKQDRTSEYEPGTATITLDNSDRKLDPSWSSSLVYGCETRLQQVRVRATYGGTTYDVFTGYIGPESWPADPFGAGQVSTVTLNCFDRLGLFQNVPLASSPYNAAIRYLGPADYWRCDADLSVLPAFTTLTNSAASPDAIAYIVDNGGGELAYIVDSLTPNDDNSAILTKAGARIVSDSSNLYPSGAIADYTWAFIFQASTNGSAQNLIRINSNSSGTGNDRWQVYVDTTGDVILRVRDNAGTSLETKTVAANPASGSGGRWDDGTAHVCIVRVRTGTPEVKVWVDGQTATSTHASIPNPYSTGYLFVGSTVADQTFDEIAYWRSAVSATDIATIYRAFLSTGMPLVGDSFTERIAHLYTIAGWPAVTADTDQIHKDALDPTLWGLGSVRSMETSLAGEIQATADGYKGATYATKAGRLRARTTLALGAGSYAADYATVQANLTDEASPAGSPTPVRRGPVSFTGYRQDRIVNRVEVSVGYDDGSNIPARILRFGIQSNTSVQAWGTRSESFTTTIQDDAYAWQLGDSTIDAFEFPVREIGDVSVNVWNDDNGTGFALGLELEQVVTVTDTPPHGSATAGYYRVIGEAWEWQGGSPWTVTLSLTEA